MNPEQAERDLLEISKDKYKIDSYNEYWESITPKTNEEILRRYVFSFLSVRTPWSGNVSSFLLLEQNKKAYNDRDELTKLIQQSRAGFHIAKAKGINKFFNEFSVNPDFFLLKEGGKDQAQRDIIMKQCYNLGFAKTSFALEMCFPLTAQVACLDTHMLQLYGYKTKEERAKVDSHKTKYYEMETHWLTTCKALNIAPFVARAMWWDKKQQQPNSRYWSYVIE